MRLSSELRTKGNFLFIKEIYSLAMIKAENFLFLIETRTSMSKRIVFLRMLKGKYFCRLFNGVQVERQTPLTLIVYGCSLVGDDCARTFQIIQNTVENQFLLSPRLNYVDTDKTIPTQHTQGISGVIITPHPLTMPSQTDYRLTYNCHTFLETSTKFRVNKGGNFNPTPIDRINKSISNTIRLTYKCYIFLETTGQGQPI